MKELNKTMYYRAKPETLETAKLLRKNMTKYEALLWEKLKGKQICGLRFRRQHPIDFFIVDFYCHEARLVVELDGEIHDQHKEYDDGRTGEMENYGLQVIRFKNSEVEYDIEKVVSKITNQIKKCLQSPPPGDLGVDLD